MDNAKRRVSAKRKRQFRGNGSTIKHSKNSSATSTNASSSKFKLPAAFDEETAEYQRKPLTGFSSSKKTLNCPEVNTRFVYGMRQIGNGFSAGFKLCGTLNLPRLSKTAYTNHENKLMSVISEVSELSMQKVASELIVLHPTKNKIVECGFSVDGTWQRRGYSSMNGCVAALSVDTGKVVDIEIMSSYCPTCRKISKMPRSIESETFAAEHVCRSNFQGSALKMEAVGATRIFQRSIVKRGYDDGDSKGFISVKDTYGKDSITKYECIGHVQKRVGKLTDSFIDRLQNYYGIAVRSNVGNLSGLQQNVVWYYCAGSSWCYYQQALSCGKMPNEKYKGLSNEVLNTIKPTYLELCTKELLTKCLHGKTQNSNECLNGVIWQRVPKEVFVCLKILKSGALDAVIQFNDGYKDCVEIFKKLNITPGYFTLKAYKHLDINRINDAERHSIPNQRFQDDGNVSRCYSTGRPRVTTPNEDRYLAVTAKRNKRSSASDLSRQLSSATGTTVSRQTVHRRLGHIGLYARRPVICVPLTATHCRLRLTWSREHALWTPQQWSCVMFFDESRTDLHVQSVTMTGYIYRDVILEQHVRLFRGAMGAELLFMDDNAHPHRANIVDQCLQSEDITRMD
ncbi:uncharacterized protein TNCV_4297681 [Trichonephila clavipes]|nr:uncharacterized protein TNCV_4297681 [Trichonephila clavipes]